MTRNQSEILNNLNKHYASHYAPNGSLKRRYPDLDDLPADQQNLIAALQKPVEYDLHWLADTLGIKSRKNAKIILKRGIDMGLVEVTHVNGKQIMGAVPG